MTPKPVFAGPRNGYHVHLSISPSAEPALFLAGLVRKLKSLCIFGLLNYDSYCRVTGDGAGLWIGWGVGNRDFLIRQISSDRWELRFLDATANVYFFIAAIISAGMAGMKQNHPLTIQNCPIVPSELRTKEAEAELRKYGYAP